ncbi:hypothetical protein H0176_17670 [Methylorubrum populi]|uniref:Uncharacterized protein n=1 Tax=Methylorubrum rhodesianum TaxID=29427 RepID=A0ABU9ZB62_9HYPH|nr:hypothetical protein [Methylorubrum rhodesianum]MBK3401446.1 hypothetical protein [Methylorubrum rhodesianum]MBY0142096.1 hypothetical protein [Methylorubrum populi]
MSAARTGSAVALSVESAAPAARSFVLIVIAVSPKFDTAKVPNSTARRKMKFCASAQFLISFEPQQPVRGKCCVEATFSGPAGVNFSAKIGCHLHDQLTKRPRDAEAATYDGQARLS